MVVFLDIPLPLPESIDLIPTGLLFSFLYCAVLAPDLSHAGEPVRPALRKKVNAFFAGGLVFSASLVTGGVIFYLLEGHLSREVRNGIDSFGLQADIYLPYPANGVLRLHGSMIMLATGCIGMRIWLRMVLGKKPAPHIARPAPVMPVTPAPQQQRQSLSESVRRKDLEAGMAAQMGKRITMHVPEPVLVENKNTPPAKRPEPPGVKKPEPQPLAAGGQMQPCVVDEEMLRPVAQLVH